MCLMLIKNAYKFSFLDPAVYNEHLIFQIGYKDTWSQGKNFLKFNLFKWRLPKGRQIK